MEEEIKTSTTSSSISTPSSNPTFYRASFTRPPSISLDLFNVSTAAMKDGIERNPFIHWKINYTYSLPPQEPCKCEC